MYPLRRRYASILNASKPPRIVFLSDLHLDFDDGTYQMDLDIQADLKSNFITRCKYIGKRTSILCIVGDVYNDYRQTLDLIMELEREGVFGFFVLGNHDYWSNGEKTMGEILQLFADATERNEYFRLLMTGRKYYVGDLCVIGDTGWTSFHNGIKRMSLKRPPSKMLGLPEFLQIKDFSLDEVLQYHNDWVSFANSVYETTADVLTLTHFPMVNFAKTHFDTWWSSKTSLKNDFGWCIYGHTHDIEGSYYNHVTQQRGYGDKCLYYSFGELVLRKMSPDFEMTVDMGMALLSVCYDDVNIVDNPTLISNGKLVSRERSIKTRGYRRCAANLWTMAELINNPIDYLSVVEDNLDGYLSNEYNDYVYGCEGLTPFNIQVIHSSIDVIRRNDLSDVRAFFIAVVVTGYVYNRAFHYLPRMRPLDDFDVIRFAAMYTVMKKHNIDVDSVYSIRSSKQKDERIEYEGVTITLPVINSTYGITKDEFLPYMQNVFKLEM